MSNFGTFWCDLGTNLGASWGDLGSSWCDLVGNFGASWDDLGSSWGDLGSNLGASNLIQKPEFWLDPASKPWVCGGLSPKNVIAMVVHIKM